MTRWSTTPKHLLGRERESLSYATAIRLKSTVPDALPLLATRATNLIINATVVEARDDHTS